MRDLWLSDDLCNFSLCCTFFLLFHISHLFTSDLARLTDLFITFYINIVSKDRRWRLWLRMNEFTDFHLFFAPNFAADFFRYHIFRNSFLRLLFYYYSQFELERNLFFVYYCPVNGERVSNTKAHSRNCDW